MLGFLWVIFSRRAARAANRGRAVGDSDRHATASPTQPRRSHRQTGGHAGGAIVLLPGPAVEGPGRCSRAHEEEAGPRQHNTANDDLRFLRVERRGKADAASIMTQFSSDLVDTEDLWVYAL
jgi:hypothetical protein